MKQKIILISGIPGTGKTTLSYYLAYQLGIDKVISVDIIKSMLQLMKSKTYEPYLYTTTHEAYQLENLSYIEGFKKHSKIICHELNNILNQCFIDDKIIIIEGAQIIPKYIDKSKHGIYSITLFSKNKDFLINRYQKKSLIRPYNWIENIKSILTIQDYLLSLKDTNFYDVSNYNYQNKILKDIKEFL